LAPRVRLGRIAAGQAPHGNGVVIGIGGAPDLMTTTRHAAFAPRNVRFVPKADIVPAVKSVAIRSPRRHGLAAEAEW